MKRNLILVLFGIIAPIALTHAEVETSTPPPQSPLAQPTPPAQAAPPAPYTLPWQLRSVMPGDVFRLDSAQAFYNAANGSGGGLIAATVFTGSKKLNPNFAVLGRFGLMNNTPPDGASPRVAGATTLTNPLVAGLYSIPVADDFRFAAFFGMTLPIGMGSGNTPSSNTQSAHSAGILARSAMDNALFAVNYLTIIPGVDLTYFYKKFTFQAEMTLLQLIRVQGELVDRDSMRTNFTSGLSVGYPFDSLISIPLSLVTELRYQRWLRNETVDAAASPARHNLSFAVGPRLSFKWEGLTFKPGLAYAQGLAGPIAKTGFTSPTNSDRILFIDLPFAF